MIHCTIHRKFTSEGSLCRSNKSLLRFILLHIHLKVRVIVSRRNRERFPCAMKIIVRRLVKMRGMCVMSEPRRENNTQKKKKKGTQYAQACLKL